MVYHVRFMGLAGAAAIMIASATTACSQQDSQPAKKNHATNAEANDKRSKGGALGGDVNTQQAAADSAGNGQTGAPPVEGSTQVQPSNVVTGLDTNSGDRSLPVNTISGSDHAGTGSVAGAGGGVDTHDTTMLPQITPGPTVGTTTPTLVPGRREFSDNLIVTGAGNGGTPHLKAFDKVNGSEVCSAFAFEENSTFGVRVAVGDVNGDKSPDIVGAPGPGGGPRVRVLSRNCSEIGSFFAYDPALRTGIYVATGDIDGDGRDEIVTGAGEGGAPHVKVFRLDGTELASFYAFGSNERFGVRVAVGDLDGDGKAEIIAAPGAGGGPAVKIFSSGGKELAAFFAYDPASRLGTYVAAGDVNGDGHADIITGAGEGGGPHVKVFSGNGFAEIASFFAYDPSLQTGVRVATTDADGDASAEIVTAPGVGGGPHIRLFSGVGTPLKDFFAYDAGLRTGVYVGGLPRK